MRAGIVLLLAAFSAQGREAASDLSGEWATQGYSARVRIEPCTDDASRLCGVIVWLWEPNDAHGAPLRDSQNPSAKLRARSLLGLPLLARFKRVANSTQPKWIDGSIYDPESGRTYRASLTRRSIEILEVEGCVLFVCRTQRWRRADSLCSP